MVTKTKTLFTETTHYNYGNPDREMERSTSLRLWVVVTAIVAGVVLFISVLLVGINAGQQASCHQAGSTMNVPTQYRFVSGCYLDINGKWIPRDQYIVNAPTTGKK